MMSLGGGKWVKPTNLDQFCLKWWNCLSWKEGMWWNPRRRTKRKTLRMVPNSINVDRGINVQKMKVRI